MSLKEVDGHIVKQLRAEFILTREQRHRLLKDKIDRARSAVESRKSFPEAIRNK